MALRDTKGIDNTALNLTGIENTFSCKYGKTCIEYFTFLLSHFTEIEILERPRKIKIKIISIVSSSLVSFYE